MEVDSSFQSLFHNLKMEGPWVSPMTWESITSESGTARPIHHQQVSQDTIYDLSAVSEAVLVRLVLNALQGMKSAIIEIEKLSNSFCSNPADRSFHRVPSLWFRLSSTHALGKMLKSISHSGLLFLFLHEFVSYFLCTDRKANSVRSDKNENFTISSNQGRSKCEMAECPPYSLVNQAFAVAIGKLLEGYVCSLNTLSSSIKSRRSMQCKVESFPMNQREGTLTCVVHSDITLLEVYLHTKELRTQIESLGSICFSEHLYQASSRDGLSLDSDVDFHNFPRGADLLTYLYVQLRNADQMHHALLKYLFVRSYEPYSGFVKLWMYRATIDDPYSEFFVQSSDTTQTTDASSLSFGKISLASIKERYGAPVPCFLKDVCRPLLRAGQQLRILVKLLDLCDHSYSSEYAPCALSVLGEILPFWVDSTSKLDFLLNPLNFGINGIEALVRKREVLYRNMFEKLQNFLKMFGEKDLRSSSNVNAFGSMPIFLGRSCVNISFPSVFYGEPQFIHGTINVASADPDSDPSCSCSDSAFQFELSPSSESSSCAADDDENTVENFYDSHETVCSSSNSMFSNLPVDCAKNSILQTYAKSNLQCFRQPRFDTFSEQVFPATSSHLQHQNKKMNKSSSPNPDTNINSRILDNSTEIGRSGGCWPLGGQLCNPFCAYMKHKDPQNLQITECCFENVESDKFSCRGTFFAEAFCPVMRSFGESPSSYLSRLSMNPMLTKPPWLPTLANSRGINFIENKSSFLRNFNFSSLTDPFNLHLESLISSSGNIFNDESSVSVQLGGLSGGVEHAGRPINAAMEGRPVLASLCSEGDTNELKGTHLPNSSGGADWAELLKYPVKNAAFGDGDIHSEQQKFFVPLDFVVDRCIIHEILLQYKYLSFFTIKFLEEGFNLKQHLTALRRYHFMEISDWADLFVMSLNSQKWHSFEHENEVGRVQGLLDLALQKSSCERDPYKERLFIYIKGKNIYQPVSSNDIHAFDFVGLGYRVDWPVDIVVTRDALQIYANIFNYLIQIRLSVMSLIDVWHYLKDVIYVLKCGRRKILCKMEDFCSLLRLRLL